MIMFINDLLWLLNKHVITPIIKLSERFFGKDKPIWGYNMKCEVCNKKKSDQFCAYNLRGETQHMAICDECLDKLYKEKGYLLVYS